MNRKRGFTLIELLLVMVIMGILILVGLGTFFSSLQKGRDTTRKANLRAITSAVEMYYNDKMGYPKDFGSGSITGCYTTDLSATGSCGKDYPVFKDSIVGGAVYMVRFPVDPISGQKYYYVSNGITYQIYAHLENTQDPQCLPDKLDASKTSCTNPNTPTGPDDCGTGAVCNYEVSSVNTIP